MAVSEAELDRRMKRFAEACREAGMKVTHQRTEVFRELAATEEHPDAETLYQRVHRRVAAISRDTVYRTLSTLEAQGLVRKGEVIFGRARYDANMARHHHFVCTECGRVLDFYSAALDGLALPAAVQSLGSIQSAHVQVQGVCRACCGGKGRRRRRPGTAKGTGRGKERVDGTEEGQAHHRVRDAR
jgi:Fur family peroxide stress response transcriptional regulator